MYMVKGLMLVTNHSVLIINCDVCIAMSGQKALMKVLML